MNKTVFFIAIDIIISMFYSIFCGFKQYSFINCSFLLGMLFFLFGILCYVWEKGFFNIIIYSFNKIGQQLHKSQGVLTEESNITIEEFAHRKNSFKYTYNLLGSGFIISLTTTILSFLAVS